MAIPFPIAPDANTWSGTSARATAVPMSGLATISWLISFSAGAAGSLVATFFQLVLRKGKELERALELQMMQQLR